MGDHRILITGSEGLIGSALRTALEARGADVTGLDLRGPDGEEGDVRHARRVRETVAGCHGIGHLAAVSRGRVGSGRLAALAADLAGTGATIMQAPPRSFDVSRFHGNPARARRLLGWAPHVERQQGLARLIHDFRLEPGALDYQAAVP